jgi:hypothetical protein
MKNDIERILESFKPRGAPAELRSRVLGAVRGELVAASRLPVLAVLARWDVRAAAAAAALLLLGVLFNTWAIRWDDARQARLYGPQPLPRQIRETVLAAQHAAGPEGAEFVERRLVAAWAYRRRAAPLDLLRYRQQLMQLAINEKEWNHASKDPQVDGHRPGRPDRSALDCQRSLRVA